MDPMRVEPTGIILIGECEIRGERCTATAQGPVTVVWTTPGRVQVNVCPVCLTDMVRTGRWRLPGARVPRRSDLAVLGPDHRPVLAVEIKRKTMGTADTRNWPREVRRNLIAHSALPRAEFFLLVWLPAHAFLWVGSDRKAPDADPDYVIDIEKSLGPYLEKHAEDDAPLYQQTELAAAAWLRDLLQTGCDEPWFRDSGLARAIQGGEVVQEYAA